MQVDGTVLRPGGGRGGRRRFFGHSSSDLPLLRPHGTSPFSLQEIHSLKAMSVCDIPEINFYSLERQEIHSLKAMSVCDIPEISFYCLERLFRSLTIF